MRELNTREAIPSKFDETLARVTAARVKAIASQRRPYNKHMVKWEKYDRLHGLRDKRK